MSSSLLGAVTERFENDDPMASGHEDEGEGDVLMRGNSDDSSEEEEEDEEEERRIRDGFIVDEDDDEDDGDEEERRRIKRRKRRHRKRREEENLEEDDLDLLEENTGTSFKKHRRIRRGGDRDSPGATISRRRVADSDEDDLDNDDLDLPRVQDIQRIFDDERDGGDGYDDDMDSFIESDEEDGGALDEEAREEKRRERRRLDQQRQRANFHSEQKEFDAGDWDEIHDVFGTGREYDWALSGEEDEVPPEERERQEMRVQDVFEPTVIKDKMMTDDDDLIRGQDVPERLQLLNCSFSKNPTISHLERLNEDDIDEAAAWVTERLAVRNKSEVTSELEAAVSFALKCIFIMDYEVPYVWTHKRDDIGGGPILPLPDLWRVYNFGQKFRSLVSRRKLLVASYTRLGVQDDYFEKELQSHFDSVEVVADGVEWLQMKHRGKKQDDLDFRFHDDDQGEAPKKHKMPSRVSAYEFARKGPAAKLALGFGIQPHHIVHNYMTSNMVHFVEDQEFSPEVYADQFCFSGSQTSPEEMLRQARLIISTELGKDPLLRREIRRLFQHEALITVVPTEKGISKIDETHAANNFKYLKRKPAALMLGSGQFLRILAAESESLVTASVHLPQEVRDDFERRLSDAFRSDNFSDTAKLWNQERSRAICEAIDQHLLPVGSKWMREFIREECEDFVAEQCAAQLRTRIDCAPLSTPHMTYGETPSILAISWGKGDPKKDAISLVFLDEEGRLRDHTKLDNLQDSDFQDEFKDLLRRRRPDIIVIGGSSMSTAKLSNRIKELIRPKANEENPSATNDQAFDIPVMYMHDAVARLYRNSKRAETEFISLSANARYCVGLARYAQSPLNEYASMLNDITAISFDMEDQHLVPREKLLIHLERAIVDVTNKVGVDINRAIGDTYQQCLLPFVCGLGPRKAQALVHKINSVGGNLINRDQFIKAGILTTKLFLNASAFLSIPHEDENRLAKNRHDDDVPDPLDGTRIHPEDYELARKMATDALELDDEDIHDEHPSHVISLIMQDSDREKKLNDLNLEEFADSLLEANNEKKKTILGLIRSELIRPFSEQRAPFRSPQEWDVLTMLSGETRSTLEVGLMIDVLVLRANPKDEFVTVRLDSGIEGIIKREFVSDDGTMNLKKNQTVRAVVADVKSNLETDNFFVELSTRAMEVESGDTTFRRVYPEESYIDKTARDRDLDMLARKRRTQVNAGRRVIKHPNFHNFNMAQAEAFLDKQQRGDVVIRPSSKGVQHLAVTWKVDDGLYQHLNVTDPTGDETSQTVGSQLIVDATHIYADLDELIVNHVQAINRKVEELMAHEKFKPGPEDELHLFLKHFVAANPAKSIYGFTLNRKKPGHFNLCFLANKNSSVQAWPIRVTPEAYYLFDAAAAGVPELCDAFKVRHLHESQNAANAMAGGKTPYGSRTPGRPGHATPGHMSSRTPGHVSTRIPGNMSIRQPARTPNPYSGGASSYAPPPPTSFGGATPAPAYFAPPQSNIPGAPPSFGGPPNPGFVPPPYGGQYPPHPGQSYGAAPPFNGFQPPTQPPPPPQPSGMHPSRLQMLQGTGWQQ